MVKKAHYLLWMMLRIQGLFDIESSIACARALGGWCKRNMICLGYPAVWYNPLFLTTTRLGQEAYGV